MIIELLILLAWVGIGVALALSDEQHERGPGSVAGGALLGPLWWVVVVDRRALAASMPAGTASSGSDVDDWRTQAV